MPSVPPSAQEWENIRPLFARLYKEEGKKLPEVRLILARNYGFEATPRMYKSRISQWGLFKYNTDPKKPRKRPISEDGETGVKRIKGASDGEEIGSSRRNNPHLSRSAPKRWSNYVAESIDTKDDPKQKDFWEWRPMSIPFQSGSVEATLQYTRVYLDWALEQPVDTEVAEPMQFAYNLQNLQGGPQILGGAIATEESIWYKFHYGIGLLERKRYAEAFHVLDAGCATVSHFLRKTPRLFFQSLIMVLGSERWKRFRPIQLHLLTFLGSMASNVIGPSHPITLMLKQLSNDNMIEQTAEAMLKRTLDSFKPKLGPGNPEVLRLQRTLCTVLQRQKDYKSCEALIRDACTDSEIKNGLHDIETRRCLRRLGYLYMEQQRYADTITVCEEVISRQPNTESPAIPDEFTICTYQNLAIACECLDQHDKSEEWLLKSVDGAQRKWGAYGAYSFEDFDGLKDMLYIEDQNRRTCLQDAAHNQGLLRKVRTRILDRHSSEQECGDYGQDRCDSHSHLARIAENRF